MTEPVPHFRALARRPVSLPARVAQAPQPGNGTGAARLVDLGLGGACVELTELLKDGTALRLLIDVPHLWDPLELDARVTWSRPGVGRAPARMGVRFEGASGRTLRLLAELLEAEAYGA
ncbi:MAG TPA: PilZ domain-containing protein [Polyangiaceae bacterium]|nr:PilZ domain-containing protein [Polyangiaceae bacterium]